MGNLVYACIAPHGGEIIPELAGKEPERMQVTRRSLEELGKRMEAASPDCLIVFTPHGTRIDGQFAVVNSETVRGFVEENSRQYYMARDVDRKLTASIKEEAERVGVPVGLLNFGTTEGPLSSLPLDWGAIVPLSFMPDVPIVIITPSRFLSYEELIIFGRAIRLAIEKSEHRIGLIASCDWSHTHDEKGPYGFHRSAESLDAQVVEYLKNNKLEAMQHFTKKEIEDAKPDGIWQTLMLAGVVREEEREVTVLSYEAPTYFGLICAEITIKERCL